MQLTRALFDAFKVESLPPPYDTAVAKIYYPARYGGSVEERNTGSIPAETELAPFPIVVMFPGINIEVATYGWLAKRLGERGIVTVTYQLVAEEMPGQVGITPGIDLDAIRPETYGSRPSALALQPVMGMLERLNRTGVLAGKLDLAKIAIGGHSAGGTLALLNAREDWLPGLQAVFTFGSHTGATTALGWPEDTLLPVETDTPILIMGGDRDGCIAESGYQYGSGNVSPTQRVEQTFERALPPNNGTNLLAILRNANHFSITSPVDDTCSRTFIDEPVNGDRSTNLVGDLICDFLCLHLRGDREAGEKLMAQKSEHQNLCRFSSK